MRYVDEHIQGFRVNLKPEKKSKFSSVVSKIRGLDQVAAIFMLSVSPLLLSVDINKKERINRKENPNTHAEGRPENVEKIKASCSSANFSVLMEKSRSQMYSLYFSCTYLSHSSVFGCFFTITT